ncbi:hypothetical protein ZWY2020_002080 [Hordeum vulgare]|nr:hypothetical protein ZWY2020_002080 [Hordeum vulgare]
MRAAATSTAISLLSPYRFRTSAPASLPYRPEAARSPAAVEPPAPPLSKFKVALCQLLVTADKARNIGGMAAMARRGAALALAMARRGAALALAMARRGMCSASAPAGEHAAATLSSEELIRMEQDCSVHKLFCKENGAEGCVNDTVLLEKTEGCHAFLALQASRYSNSVCLETKASKKGAKETQNDSCMERRKIGLTLCTDGSYHELRIKTMAADEQSLLVEEVEASVGKGSFGRAGGVQDRVEIQRPEVRLRRGRHYRTRRIPRKIIASRLAFIHDGPTLKS